MSLRDTLLLGEALATLKSIPDNTYDSIVTDPPYGMSDHDAEDIIEALSAWVKGEVYQPRMKGGMMGRAWDAFVPGPELWKECYRALKPGGYILAASSTRTQDLLGIALRLAEFECRDTIVWIKSGGFPKSVNISKSTLKQVESRYGKTRCLCVDPGGGNFAGNDVRLQCGEKVGVARRTGEDQTEKDGGRSFPHVSTTGDRSLPRVRKTNSEKKQTTEEVSAPVLYEGVRKRGTEETGHGHAEVWTGLEKEKGRDPEKGRSVSGVRQNDRAVGTQTACAPPETVSSRGEQPSGEPSESLRLMSPHCGICDNSRTGCDPDRRETRRVVFDYQSGGGDPVAQVCSWCGQPDQKWLDGLIPLGSALKPSHEPFLLFRKPLVGTIAENVLKHGTGGLNIDGCRIAVGANEPDSGAMYYRNRGKEMPENEQSYFGAEGDRKVQCDPMPGGRWPGNVLFSHKTTAWYSVRHDTPKGILQAILAHYGSIKTLRNVRDPHSGDAFGSEDQKVLLEGVRWRSSKGGEENGVGGDHLPALRRTVQGHSGMGAERSEKILFEGVPRQGQRSRMSVGNTTHGQIQRKDVEFHEGETPAREILPMEGGALHSESRVHTRDGKQLLGGDAADGAADGGRETLCHGASSDCGNVPGETTAEIGTGASREWGERRQQTGESDCNAQERTQYSPPGGGKGTVGSSTGSPETQRREYAFEVREDCIPVEWRDYFVRTSVEGCQKIGTKKVKTGTAYEVETNKGKSGYGGGWTSMNRVCGYASEDGTETVPTWECETGCPVATLDEQSGRTSVTGVRSKDSQDAEVRETVWGPSNHRSVEYPGDSGGASRFFLCTEPETKGCEPGCPVAELDAQSGTLKSGKLDLNEERGTSEMGGGKVLREYEPNEGGASRFFLCTDSEKAEGEWTCEEGCPVAALDEQSGILKSGELNPGHKRGGSHEFGGLKKGVIDQSYGGDSGGASRFFFCAKASKKEKTADGKVPNKHISVKPLKLMRYLCRLVTPPGGHILDPFMGSGSTGVAAIQEGFKFTGIEMEKESHKTAVARILLADNPLLWADDLGEETEEEALEEKEPVVEEPKSLMDILGIG